MKYSENYFKDYSKTFKNKKDKGLLASKVDFTIRIDNREFEFWNYREVLYSGTYKRFEKSEYRQDNHKYERSPFELYVRDRLKVFDRDERTLIIVTDYSEREGSFIITFSFFVFTTFMNYGQFRESLDYIRDDFRFFIRDIFPPNTYIDVDFEDSPNRLVTDFSEGLMRQTTETVNREFRKLKLIVMFIGLLCLGFSFYAAYKIETQPIQTFDTSTIQSIIKTEIDKYNSEKNNEELVRLLKQQLQQTTNENIKSKE